jgi:hypothetical protein
MPAPAVRLRAEFSDILGEVWQLNIHDSNYSGSVVSFNVGGDAYQLRYEGNNEDRHQPVIGSSLEFSIIENSASITTFLDELPTTFEGELTVTLRYDPDGVNTLYWAGIILPEQVVRQDEAYPQEVRIIASDDLANLVGIKFNNNGDPYDYTDGRTFREHIVKHCLGKLRTIDHWGATDIFASLDCAYTPSNLYATGADFFSKLRVNTETWLNPDNEGAIEFFNTFEVLESFCRVLNARLFLANGRFWMIPIVSHHDSQTLSYFNYYSDASYTSSSSADVGLTLQTDIIKETGWEYTHQLPLKEVRRTYKFSGQQSIIGVQEHLEGDFGTDLFNLPDYTFASGTKFRVTFDNSHFMTGQGGNNQLARVDLIVLLKVGAYYAKWEHTYSSGSAGYYYDFLSSHYITQYGEPTWTTTNTDRTYVRIRNVNKNTGQAYPSIDPLGMIGNLPNEFTTGELPIEANGIQMRVGFQVLNTNGTVNTTWTNATNVNLYNVKVYIEGNDGDTIDYVATNALSARANLDNGTVLLGSIDSDQARGLIFVQTGASTHSKTETWSSTTFSGAYDINELGVQEILRGQKYPLLLERGTLYANNVGTLLHMYNVVLSDSRRMGIYQYTYNGRMRNYDIELFHITGNATDVSVVPKPPKILNPPVAPAAGSFPGVIDEAANAKFLVDTLDSTVSGLSVRLERLYDTFQPLDDDDHTVTKIVHEANATTGMAVTLEEGNAQIISNSGNTYWSLGESSPGQMRVFVQDDATPTPNSVGAMFITAASNAGKVGINTSTPAAALDVVGNIAVSGSVDGVDISTLNTVATKDVPVYNNTASTITKGTIVRESGAQSTTGELRIAAFNSLLSVDAHRILGVMTEDIAAGASGYARAVGHVRGLNTNSFTVGTLLYASATTAGAWTSALPTAYNSYAQIIGWVTKQNATTGEIYVRIVPATTLENLANVKDQPPSVGQVLVYDGSVWAGTTQATYSSIGIPGATPPAGGFKSVWFQDSAGNMTYDEAFTYDTSTNTLEIDGTATTAGVLRLGEATNNGTNYVGIQAPATLAANTTYTLPSADGTSGQLLSTNGSGTLSWATRKATQVTGKTVATGAWSLVSGFYEASISDAAISATSIVDVIPDNGSAATAATAGVLPRTDSSSGAVKIYATATPAATLTVTINIFDL